MLFKEKRPDLIHNWDNGKNTVNNLCINKIRESSSKYIYMTCNNGHEIYDKVINICKRKTLCKKCKIVDKTQEFIKKAKKKFKKKYSYKEVNYVSNLIPVKIYCWKHKIINQTPKSFLTKGCKLCCLKKGEKKICEWLTKCNIKFEIEKTFKDLKYKGSLRCDFYLEDLNTVIEYDGNQHFRKKLKDGKDRSEKLKLRKTRDQIKNKFCIENKINLLRIKYTEYKYCVSYINKFITLVKRDNKLGIRYYRYFTNHKNSTKLFYSIDSDGKKKNLSFTSL